MKKEDLGTRHHEVLRNLSCLPGNMIGIHGMENMTEFVLHELSHERCFNFNKAAFIVNNPDFDCLKGVAGVSRDQISHENIWSDTNKFSAHMKISPFNQKVRTLMHSSLKRDAKTQKEKMAMIAGDLGIYNHHFCSWDMKHYNQGFLVFEKMNNTDPVLDDHLLNALCLLSFCPIF